MKRSSGFTLIEVLITTVILVVAILSTLGLFGHFLLFSRESGSLAMAIYEAKTRMEEICVNSYQVIRNGDAGPPVVLAYTNNGAKKETPFALTSNLTGMGTVYAEELPEDSPVLPGLIRIKVVVCYRQGQRIVGEDSNLNGRLDAGEDTNGNKELDSPSEIERTVVNKEI